MNIKYVLCVKHYCKLQKCSNKHCEQIKNIDYVTYNYLVILGLMFTRQTLYH